MVRSSNALAYALPGLVNRAGQPLSVDFSAAPGYSKNIAPEPGSCTPKFCGQRRTGVSLLKGKSPRELFSSSDLSRRTSYPVRHVSPLTEESVMGIIAWIVLGLGRAYR